MKNTNINTTNEWITIKQAMELLQVTSRTTLYKYAHNFNIRVTKPLGRVYYNVTDIMKVLENKAVVLGV